MSNNGLLHADGNTLGIRFRFEFFRIFNLLYGLWKVAGNSNAAAKMNFNAPPPDWCADIEAILLSGNKNVIPVARRTALRAQLKELFGEGVASFREMGPKEARYLRLCVDLPGIRVKIAGCSKRTGSINQTWFEYYFSWDIEKPELKESGRKALCALFRGTGLVSRTISIDGNEVSLTTAVSAFAPGAIKAANDERKALWARQDSEETARKKMKTTPLSFGELP